MGDKAIRGNRLTKRKGPHGYASQPHLSVHAKGGRAGKFGGGRTNLLEELGRVEAEPSNRNRRAEISRVHGELNRGYKHGGKTKTPEHYLVHGYGSTYKPKRTKKAIGGVIKGAQKIISKIKPKPKGKGLGSGIKPSEAKDILKSDKITRSEYLKQWSPYFGGRSLKQEMKETAKKGKAKGGRAGYAIGGTAAKALTRALRPKGVFKPKKKKKVYPETEDLTHQKGPYVGDVGSERPGIKRREWGRGKPDWLKRPKARDIEGYKPLPSLPKRPNWKPLPSRPKRPKWEKPIGKFPPKEGRVMEKPIGKFPPEEGRKMQPLKKGGKTDKKWIQKAVDPKHKGYCTPMTKKTCTPARKALARTFKKKAKTGWG